VSFVFSAVSVLSFTCRRRHAVHQHLTCGGRRSSCCPSRKGHKTGARLTVPHGGVEIRDMLLTDGCPDHSDGHAATKYATPHKNIEFFAQTIVFGRPSGAISHFFDDLPSRLRPRSLNPPCATDTKQRSFCSAWSPLAPLQGKKRSQISETTCLSPWERRCFAPLLIFPARQRPGRAGDSPQPIESQPSH
jgi:hypothetical protein